MCSASQDDQQDLYGHDGHDGHDGYDGHGEPLSLTPSDAALWQTDESAFSPSMNSDHSIIASLPSSAQFNECFSYIENDNDEGEHALRDELYLSDPSQNVRQSRETSVLD